MKNLPRLEELPALLAVGVLNGRLGSNRCIEKKPMISAENDLQAVQCWLGEYTHKKTTHQTYRKEAERLLLWCIVNAKKPLSSLNRNDLEAYAQFLEDPQPANLWCGKKGGYRLSRGQSGWKPFERGLGPSSKRAALSIIGSLMDYLYRARYLDSNPLSLMRTLKHHKAFSAEQKIKVYDRILADDEWQALVETLNEWPGANSEETIEKFRLKFIVGLLYFLGLRVGDVANSTWQSFKKINDRWWFVVVGKGSKLAKIPVNNALLKVMIDYRVHLDMTVYPQDGDSTPLIHSLRNRNKSISERQISNLIKTLALKAMKKFPDQIAKREKLSRLSPHWFRHQCASKQARLGLPMEHIRENMRHESQQTTLIYMHADDEERGINLEKLTW